MANRLERKKVVDVVAVKSDINVNNINKFIKGEHYAYTRSNHPRKNPLGISLALLGGVKSETDLPPVKRALLSQWFA